MLQLLVCSPNYLLGFPPRNKSWSIYQEHWHRRSSWLTNQKIGTILSFYIWIAQLPSWNTRYRNSNIWVSTGIMWISVILYICTVPRSRSTIWIYIIFLYPSKWILRLLMLGQDQTRYIWARYRTQNISIRSYGICKNSKDSQNFAKTV